ncbi:MAG: hypothetical protein R2716_11060 [Microthrixaceae bacterium]
MAELRGRFDRGLARNGIVGEAAEAIWQKLAAFANYGFPESHSVSFAYLVYASSWLKYHYPAAFCAGLLNAQPMGFYSPQSLTQDARRHGVQVLGPDLHASGAHCGLEWSTARGESGHEARAREDSEPGTWGWGGPAVRLGISSVRGIGEDLAERIVAAAPYSGPDELVRRVGLDRSQMEALATAGALGCFEDRDGLPLPRRGPLGRRGRVQGASRPAPGDGRGDRGSSASRDGRTRGGVGGPVGDRCRPRRASHEVPP